MQTNPPKVTNPTKVTYQIETWLTFSKTWLPSQNTFPSNRQYNAEVAFDIEYIFGIPCRVTISDFFVHHRCSTCNNGRTCCTVMRPGMCGNAFARND